MILSSFTHIPTLKRVPHPKKELWIVISKKTRLNRSPSQQRTLLCYIEKDKTESFPIPTENSALLHQKRQDWTVPHANKELCIVISKKTRLNRSPSQQRTLHCYIEEDKTEPLPIRTENSALLYRKRQDWTVSHLNSELGAVTSKKTRLNRSPSQQRTLHCYLEKDKTELFRISTKNSALLHRKRQDWTVPHPNREL